MRRERRGSVKAGGASDRKGGHPAGFLGGKGAPLKGGRDEGWGLRGQGDHLSHILMSTFISSVHAERTTCPHGLLADARPPGTSWPERLPWVRQPVHTTSPWASSGSRGSSRMRENREPDLP